MASILFNPAYNNRPQSHLPVIGACFFSFFYGFITPGDISENHTDTIFASVPYALYCAVIYYPPLLKHIFTLYVIADQEEDGIHHSLDHDLRQCRQQGCTAGHENGAEQHLDDGQGDVSGRRPADLLPALEDDLVVHGKVIGRREDTGQDGRHRHIRNPV